VKDQRRRLALLFAAMLMIMIGYGIFIPVMPFYLGSLGANGRDLGLLMATFAVTQLVCAPIWGQLSDRIGRRPVLLIGLAGAVVTQVIYGLSSHLWMFFLARALAGALTSATFPTALAYIGDITSPEKRSGAMGLVTAAMYSGMMLGPGLGGWLARYGLTVPFFGAAAMSAVVLGFVAFALPESLEQEQRRPTAWRAQPLPLGDIRAALAGPLGLLLVLTFLVSFGMSHFWAMFGLYAMRRYNYGTDEVSAVMSAIGVGSALVQGMLTGRVSARWGESRVTQWALLMSTLGFLLMLAARDFVSVLITTCLFVMASSLLNPVLSAQVSKRAENGQGAAMGINNSFQSLGLVAGPIWAGMVLDVNVMLPYLSGSLVMAIGVLATVIGPRARQTVSPGPDPRTLELGR